VSYIAHDQKGKIPQGLGGRALAHLILRPLCRSWSIQWAAAPPWSELHSTCTCSLPCESFACLGPSWSCCSVILKLCQIVLPGSGNKMKVCMWKHTVGLVLITQ